MTGEYLSNDRQRIAIPQLDRTWLKEHGTPPPAAISQKREFFKCPPETIGYFAPRMPKIGARRLVANSQKLAIGGPFSEYPGQFLQSPDCVAGVRGFELAHS
jgi:hypothetical protein